ncbi:cell division protein ZipA [Psychromonas ingrahamii 37]|uniref:Cell division protein ZipA n=1 Tax=Psychromonas ingrahamii (strain DSM 17664 / CCUG 51855 / 37) TaxID=357804 RepID=A1SX62_PSYIN|nr:cell division protein ZipA [Psychromonas ingrahamii]ABM04077.1 cell division protein ZipA [Psychromonas ingrahamii 37]
MQHFQSILIFIGLIAIAAVLIHGYLINRKEKKVLFENKITTDIFSEKENVDPAEDAIDDLKFNYRSDQDDQEQIDFSISEDDDFEALHFNGQEDSDKKDSPKVNLSDSLPDESLQESSLNVKEKETDQETEDGKVNYFELEADDEKAAANNANNEPQDVFIFNVVAKEGTKLLGHDLLQFFLTSGFRFGERSIFHRHLHSDGNGPILFSIANMLEPGIFDPDRMGRISCEGVSFFVVAPNLEINIKTAFDMMLTAVEQMTEEFDCVVLNAQREPLTEQEYRDDHQRLMRYV